MSDGTNARHVKIVGSYWMRFSLRTGGGLMALLLALVTGLSVAQAFITPVENLMKEAPKLGHSEGEAADSIAAIAESEQIVDALEWLTGQDEDEIEYLVQEQPALLSVIWIFLLAFIPFLTVLSSFNQTSGDIGSKGLRYLLLRTERSNIYLGRSVGTLLFSTASLLLLLVLVLLYVGMKLKLYPFGDLASSGLHGFLALFFLSLPYIAMCGWLSAMFDSAFGSLAICLLVAAFPIIFFKMVNWASESDLAWLDQLLPWGWKYDLLSGDIGTRLLAYGVMLGFTAVFLVLGMRQFQKRDL